MDKEYCILKDYPYARFIEPQWVFLAGEAEHRPSPAVPGNEIQPGRSPQTDSQSSAPVILGWEAEWDYQVSAIG